MRIFILLLLFTFIGPIQAQRSDFKEIDFSRAESIANRYKGEELNNLPILTHQLTSQLNTDVERFRAIYYWVSHNVKGDFSMMSRNDRKRKKFRNDPEALNRWNRKFKKIMFDRMLADKETVCTGYAYLIKELANLAGIEGVIIHGYGPTNKLKDDNLNGPNHSWNAVKLDGKWYLCDATWSSGYTDMSTFLFHFKYDDSLFLMDPSEFQKSHQPLDEKWTLIKPHTFARLQN